jgi:hypothetical protein
LKNLAGKHLPWYKQGKVQGELGTEYSNVHGENDTEKGCPCPKMGFGGKILLGVFGNVSVGISGDLRGYGVEWVFGKPFSFDLLKPSIEATISLNFEIRAQVGITGSARGHWNKYLEY